eukprot:scaffold628112_cov23-Prasinocladus_malaysianus.AAC.1
MEVKSIEKSNFLAPGYRQSHVVPKMFQEVWFDQSSIHHKFKSYIRYAAFDVTQQCYTVFIDDLVQFDTPVITRVNAVST